MDKNIDDYKKYFDDMDQYSLIHYCMDMNNAMDMDKTLMYIQKLVEHDDKKEGIYKTLAYLQKLIKIINMAYLDSEYLENELKEEGRIKLNDMILLFDSFIEDDAVDDDAENDIDENITWN
jgi:hypothetical protein